MTRAPGRTVTRFRKKLAPDQWDPDTSISHDLDPQSPGFTFCGVRIGRLLEQGGPWDYTNWDGVNCYRCQNKRTGRRT